MGKRNWSPEDWRVALAFGCVICLAVVAVILEWVKS